jgi:hypothetical protein
VRERRGFVFWRTGLWKNQRADGAPLVRRNRTEHLLLHAGAQQGWRLAVAPDFSMAAV